MGWQRSSFGRRLASALASAPRAIYRQGRRGLGIRGEAELYYVVPGANWVIDRVGRYVTRSIQSRFGWPAHVTSTPQLLVDHVLHYGELWAFVRSLGSRRNSRNTLVVTVFHGDRSERFPEMRIAIDRLLDHASLPARIVTACRIMENRLVRWGVPREKVLRIPLGVDLERFQPAPAERRRELRRGLGIPDGALCIGSFQKDGKGWEEGLSPKMEKGPDVFLEVIRRLFSQYRIFVLLTGPARGYVARGLEALGVPYRHRCLPDYRLLPEYYHCLDLYLITSREEGGPESVLESLATGVPLVSTRVGLAPDVVDHGRNGFLAEPEDVEGLAGLAARVLENPDLGRTFSRNGPPAVRAHDWGSIAARYYQELYRPILDELAR